MYSSLASVTISENVTSIGENAFAFCSSLTSVTIPADVTEIGDEVFLYCNLLTSVVFENTDGWTTQRYGDISSSDLTDPATATKYLTDAYYGRSIWTCD